MSNIEYGKNSTDITVIDELAKRELFEAYFSTVLSDDESEDETTAIHEVVPIDGAIFAHTIRLFNDEISFVPEGISSLVLNRISDTICYPSLLLSR